MVSQATSDPAPDVLAALVSRRLGRRVILASGAACAIQTLQLQSALAVSGGADAARVVEETPSTTEGRPPLPGSDHVTRVAHGLPLPAWVTSGRGPGYWKQARHHSAWVGYAPSQTFQEVFGRTLPGSAPTLTLQQALEQGGGQLVALGRHAVAALLNASAGLAAGGRMPGDVIAWVQGVLERV